MRAWLLIAACIWAQMCQAQLVTLPIPGAPGLSVTVATGTAAQPLSVIAGQPGATNVTMADDANVSVPLQFVFPYWGQQFTQSWMHSNGVVSFQSPNQTGNFCCTGQNLAATQAAGLNYAIMPLWTDLIAQAQGSHWILSQPTAMTYGWYNVNQYGSSNTSSFELRIDRTGLVDMRLQGALITASPVTIGMTGNLAQGEFVQHFYGNNFSTQSLQVAALSGTTFVDPCPANPLSSPSCPGYQAAFFAQQCSITALYDPACPGYAQAFFNQQCAITALYNAQCPGYAAAYFEQQCSISPLYDSACPGYDKAYFDKQCSLDGLYDRKCPNFATAYATQQLAVPATTSAPPAVPATVTVAATGTTSAPSVSPADVTSAVPLVTPTQSTGPTAVTAVAASVSPSTPPAAPPAAPVTRAQQLAQARQQAQRRAVAAQGAAAQERAAKATSLEAQREAQDTVITVMGFNPAFAAYENRVLEDAKFYQPRAIYAGQTTVDNRRALGALTGTSDTRWQLMREQQYRLESRP